MKPTVFVSLLGTIAFTAAATAQTSFAPQYSPLGQMPNIEIQADLNGDGVPDIVTFSNGTEALLSNGSGGFSVHDYAFDSRAYIPLTSGDYNGDGKADVLFYDYAGGSALLKVGYGDGKGDFSSVVAVPNAPGLTTGNQTSILAQTADFNGDGRPDILLAYSPNSGPGGNVMANVKVELLVNNGNGFTDAGTVYTYKVPSGATTDISSQSPTLDFLQGDFDSDGHADVALRVRYAGQSGVSTNLVVLYGNGAGKFTPVTVFSNRQSTIELAAADLNNDGRSDLVGVDKSTTSDVYQLHFFYGAAGRTFTESTSPLAVGAISPPWYYARPAIADFDGNGLKDIAYGALGMNSTGGLEVYYQAAPGKFSSGVYTTTDTFNVTNGTTPFTSYFAGDFNRDGKADAILMTSDTAQSHPNTAAVLTNTGSGQTGKCAVHRIGIHTCSLASSGGTLYVRFGASLFTPMRKLEVWIDGTKRSETYQVVDHEGYADVNLKIATGTHRVDLYAVGFDGTLLEHAGYNVTVQ